MRLLLCGLIAAALLPLTAVASEAGTAAAPTGTPSTSRATARVPGAAAAPRAQEPTVHQVRRIGTSVRDRPIRAFRLGERSATVKAVILGSMHGNEKAGMVVVDSLRKGPPVSGVDLWVVRTMNPDGVVRNTRGNARGVDLNRNFGHRWAPLTGPYYSGKRRWSEPETRAMRRFLNDVDPRFIVSFHQPLHGVGRSAERKPFQRRLARGLGLKIKSFNCSGVCHGTMTSWFNKNHRGTAITVEFGRSPRAKYLRNRATTGTLRAVLGRR